MIWISRYSNNSISCDIFLFLVEYGGHMMHDLYRYSFSKCQATCFNRIVEKKCGCLSALFGVGSLHFNPSAYRWCSMNRTSEENLCVEELLRIYAMEGWYLICQIHIKKKNISGYDLMSCRHSLYFYLFRACVYSLQHGMYWKIVQGN